MRVSMGILLPQLRPLRYPETVLFVDDGESQVLKLHGRLEEGMGADQYLQAATRQTIVNVLSLGSFCRARQKRDGNAHNIRILLQVLEMLLSQYFGRRHECTLRAAVNGKQHGDKRNDGFPAPYISLQQSIHLFSGTQVCIDFMNYSLLSVCQFKRQVIVVKLSDQCCGVEHLSAKFMLS